MKSQIIGLKVASALFMLMALAHAVRLILGWKVQVGDFSAGVWPSVAAIVVTAGLSIWLGKLACGSRTDAVSPPPKS